MGTAAFYDDLVADPRVREGDGRWYAATPPGFGGRPLPPSFVPSVESYARLTTDLADELGCATVVGHSYFANVAIEMAASGFGGRVVLLSPCLSFDDEEKDLKVLNRVGRLPGLGPLVWSLAPRMVPSGMKGRFPASRHEELVAEMKRIDPVVTRDLVLRYFDHLNKHGSLVGRLGRSGVAAWIVRGEDDEIGLLPEEREGLLSCPALELITVPGARHFLMTDQPGAVVDVILAATKRHVHELAGV